MRVFLQGTVTEVKNSHQEKRVAGEGKDLNVKIHLLLLSQIFLGISVSSVNDD